MSVERQLGVVIGGSLKEGVEVKLDPAVSVEEVKVGAYVVVEGETKRFFCLVTDVRLAALDSRALTAPPAFDDDLLAEVWSGAGVYGVIEVMPLLTLDRRTGALDGPQPVKSVPRHFAPVREAAEEDVALVFGRDEGSFFEIGTPIDMETKVCLDLAKLVERSVGVFGKSGTGKTFLTRLLLAGIIQRQVAATLVFDMHNEYGWQGSGESDPPPEGLKRLFGERVSIFSLDPPSTRRRGAPCDFELAIGYDQIEPEDIELLAETLGLSGPMIEATHLLERQYGRRWLATLLEASTDADRQQLAAGLGAHAASVGALWRKLSKLARFDFLKREPPADYLRAILDRLARGVNVVIEFGKFRSLEAYILVANVLTRRIHHHYVDAMERALGEGREEPRPLVITIEEAHKFLHPRVASQTIFGEIAREMRKYNVTLLVVDQRPSGIDEEVLSQIGTRLCCLLDNDKDVDAVLAGASGKSELRSVLARLETRQQALIFGHAVPMPVVIKTRNYGPEFYRAVRTFRDLATLSCEERREAHEAIVRELFD
ncbi:MAG: ATP-binding protein [Chloroflexota bacterium]|nr:ATP-binding protein [Dehalococcoidia bacterium]MDW8253476.1 ATP-binding protein [Chloroflexota bacterium]